MEILFPLRESEQGFWFLWLIEENDHWAALFFPPRYSLIFCPPFWPLPQPKSFLADEIVRMDL